MDDGFGTQPGDLAAAAARFDEAAGVVADALGELRAALGGLGEALGADEQGRAFGAQYEPAAARGLAAIEQEAAGVRSLGDALRATAQDYAATEGSLADGLAKPP